MKKIYLIMFLFLFSCNKDKKSEKIIAQYTVDIDGAKHVNEIKTSSIFKKVNTIIIEEDDVTLYNSLLDFQVVDNYVFVVDFLKDNSLSVFNKQGRFVKKIGRIGLGPGEYIRVTDCAIDKETENVYLLDDFGKKVIQYNYITGEYINTININGSPSLHFIQYCNNNIYLSNCSYTEEDHMLIKIDLKNKKQTEHLSANKYNAGWTKPDRNEFNFFSLKTGKIPKYKQMMMNTVFAISKDSVYPYINLKQKDWVTHNDILSEEKLEELENLEDTEDQFSILNKKHKNYAIANYIEFNEFIFLSYGYGLNYVLYNKDKNETITTNNFLDDLLYTKTIPHGTKFMFSDSRAAYFLKSIESLSNSTEGDYSVLADNLDKKDELIKLIESGSEQFVIFEYVFK